MASVRMPRVLGRGDTDKKEYSGCDRDDEAFHMEPPDVEGRRPRHGQQEKEGTRRLSTNVSMRARTLLPET
jgi:hypothetical protein